MLLSYPVGFRESRINGIGDRGFAFGLQNRIVELSGKEKLDIKTRDNPIKEQCAPPSENVGNTLIWFLTPKSASNRLSNEIHSTLEKRANVESTEWLPQKSPVHQVAIRSIH